MLIRLGSELYFDSGINCEFQISKRNSNPYCSYPYVDCVSPQDTYLCWRTSKPLLRLPSAFVAHWLFTPLMSYSSGLYTQKKRERKLNPSIEIAKLILCILSWASFIIYSPIEVFSYCQTTKNFISLTIHRHSKSWLKSSGAHRHTKSGSINPRWKIHRISPAITDYCLENRFKTLSIGIRIKRLD